MRAPSQHLSTSVDGWPPSLPRLCSWPGTFYAIICLGFPRPERHLSDNLVPRQ